MKPNERWVKSGLLGQGINAHYDIDLRTPHSSGPVIAQVLVAHVSEEARRTASKRADLICSIPELIKRAEAAEARAAQLEAERDALRIKLNMARHTLSCIMSWAKTETPDPNERAAFAKWSSDALEITA